MPQLEQISTFVGQVFWLAITFGILYVVMWKSALPRIASILQERQERIDDDLRKAEALKTEAESVLAAYETAMATARSDAQAILSESAQAFAVEAAERRDALTGWIGEQTAAAESRIKDARRDALASILEMAGEVAQAATGRLVDIAVAEGDVEAVVADVVKERG